MQVFFGDLHLFDGKVASHVNYEKECLTIMDEMYTGCIEIKEKCCAKDEPFYVYFSGDLSGALAAKRFMTLSFRSEVCKWLLRLNDITDGNLYSIRGNHDYSATDMTELVFFETLGLIKILDQIDVPFDKVRITGFDYGAYDREFELHDEYLNIALTHNNFAFNDINMGFYKGNYIYVEDIKPLNKVDVIFAGHIHNPTSFYVKEIYEGKPIKLMYLGSPTRPANEANMWDSVNIGIVQKGEVTAFTFELMEKESIFNLTAIDDDNELKKLVADRKDIEESMKEIINNLLDYNTNKFFGSLLDQIMLYPGYTENVKLLAKKYYETAL